VRAEVRRICSAIEYVVIDALFSITDDGAEADSVLDSGDRQRKVGPPQP
jgi:hypothetical protein